MTDVTCVDTLLLIVASVALFAMAWLSGFWSGRK